MTKHPFSLVTTLELAGSKIGVYGSYEKPLFLVREILCALQANKLVDNICTSPDDLGVLKTADNSDMPQWYTTRDGLRAILTYITPVHAGDCIRVLRKALTEKMGVKKVADGTYQIGLPTVPKVEDIMVHPGIDSLYRLVDSLKQSNIFVAQAFREIYGDDEDMENNSEFIAIQQTIQAAITQSCTEIARFMSERIISA